MTEASPVGLFPFVVICSLLIVRYGLREEEEEGRKEGGWGGGEKKTVRAPGGAEDVKN